MENKKKSHLAITVWLCIIIIVSAVVIMANYLRMLAEQQGDSRLPNIQALEQDLELVNHRGEKVSLHQLRGKVWALGYVFTQCPAGCVGLMEEMRKLQKEFADEDQFHLVAMSADPEHDTPEVLAQWVADKGFDDSNWWFLTGSPDEIRSYMSKNFRFPVKERTDPEEIANFGRWEHPLKVVLVDRRGMIRNYYDLMNIHASELEWDRLREDIPRLLTEKNALKSTKD